MAADTPEATDDLAPYTVDVNKKPGPNWSHSVSVEAIQRLRGAGATKEAVDTMRFMAIVATDDGGVQLEWHAHGWDVELEVTPGGEPEGFYMDRRDA